MRGRVGLAAVGIVLTVELGCALGSDRAPGCHTDADCDTGFICRAGACFLAEDSPPGTDGGADAPAEAD